MKFFKILGFVFTLITLSTFSIYCQIDNNYEFIRLNDDITQSTISSIIKDDNGMLWLGSSGDGVFRYNSLNFKNYKKKTISNKNTLNSSFIHTLHKDSNNNIWAGTQEGINKYNRNLDEFISVDITEKKSNIKYAVHAIYGFDDKNILIGTHQNGLIKLNIENQEFKNIIYKSNESSSLLVNSIAKSLDNKFFIGTNHGLMIYDQYAETMELAKFDLSSKYEKITKSIESIIIDRQNTIWLGTSQKGLIKISRNNDLYQIEKLEITKKRILSLSLKENGNILCGTENDGLFEIDLKNNKTINYRFNKNIQNGIKSNSIWSIFSDSKDRIWLGYYNNGVDV
ncbi:MAG: hypothetical protein L7S44_01855, partial [Flavobacteriaceae bacterium]|nr:hypothetical protein [Flavobacteriaceae bacterium]